MATHAARVRAMAEIAAHPVTEAHRAMGLAESPTTVERGACPATADRAEHRITAAAADLAAADTIRRRVADVPPADTLLAAAIRAAEDILAVAAIPAAEDMAAVIARSSLTSLETKVSEGSSNLM